MLDLTRFYKACNPSKTLDTSKPEDRKYYIDFALARGGTIIREIERTIALDTCHEHHLPFPGRSPNNPVLGNHDCAIIG